MMPHSALPSSPEKTSHKKRTAPLPSQVLITHNNTPTWHGDRRRRIKPKRLIIPPVNDHAAANDDDDEKKNTVRNDEGYRTSDPFEFDAMKLFWDLTSRRIHRPLPATTSILSVAQHKHHRASTTLDTNDDKVSEMADSNAPKVEKLKKINESRTGKDAPILEAFFAGLNARFQCDEEGNKNVETEEGEGRSHVAAIDEGGDGEHRTLSSPLDAISATLTRGHHRRFQELLLELEKSGNLPRHRPYPASATTKPKKYFPQNHLREKEFHKLCELFREERRLYGLAWDLFRQENIDRFLIGFKVQGPASSFVHTNSQLVSRYATRWKGSPQTPSLKPLKYGKCCQAISLHVIKSSYYDQSQSQSQERYMRVHMETFSPIIVATSKGGSEDSCDEPKKMPTLEKNWMESFCSKDKQIRPTPQCRQNEQQPSSFLELNDVSLLCNDDKAKRLAIKHKADMIVTADALKALMIRPGELTSRWMIPFSLSEELDGRSVSTTNPSKTTTRNTHARQRRIMTIVEDPMPQQSTPRECLSVGFTEALYTRAVSMDSDFANDTPAPNANLNHVYTLLNIPHPTRRQDECKVLVRSTNSLQDEEEHPIHLGCKLDYFVEHGLVEDYTSMDRASWLLEKILQPDSSYVVCHVDPNSAQLSKIEEKNLVDALAVSDSMLDRNLGVLGPFEDVVSSSKDVGMHFHIMADAIFGLKLVNSGREGEFMVCLPGRGLETSHTEATNATIHKALNDNEVMATIDIEKQLGEANTVSLGRSTLYDCFQLWQWNDDRMAFTFPLEESSN